MVGVEGHSGAWSGPSASAISERGSKCVSRSLHHLGQDKLDLRVSPFESRVLGDHACCCL
jgi:hypothetical protein